MMKKSEMAKPNRFWKRSGLWIKSIHSPPPFPPPKSVVGFGCKRHSLQNGVA